MLRSSSARIVFFGSVLYMLLLGSMLPALLIPIVMIVSLGLLTVNFALWAASYRWGGWQWYRTPLDGVIWLWVLGTVVAALANPEHLRRAPTPAWLILALMCGWYVLHSALANGVLRRSHLLDILIVAGVYSFVTAISEITYPYQVRDGLFGMVRVSANTGNPNLLAAVILPVIAASFGRAWSQTGISRILLGLFGVLSVGMLVMSYSRAGYLGGAALVGVFALAFMADRGWLTPAGARRAWQRASTLQRGITVFVVIGVAAGAAGGAFFMLRSFDAPGREADLRTYLWEAAWNGFLAKPLTGNGLHSTPRVILDASSVPPRVPQAHAHNFPLQVLNELGIIGGIAMVATLAALFRSGIRAWRQADTPKERHLIAAGWAGAVGLGVQNLFDMTFWTTYIALAGLIILLAMTAQPAPVPEPRSRKRLSLAVVGTVMVVLLVTGFYSYTKTARYTDALFTGGRDGDWATSAAMLSDLIAEDPRQPVYYANQAMLYAIMANENNDPALAQQAIASFDHAREYGMDSGVLHLNLAALYAQLGDLGTADAELAQALEYASDSTIMLVNAALAAERWGMPDTARALWRDLFAREGFEDMDLPLYPVVQESAIAAEFEFPPLTPYGQAVAALVSGDPTETLALLDTISPQTAQHRALRAMAQAALGQDAHATLESALTTLRTPADHWFTLYIQHKLEDTPIPVIALPFSATSLNIIDESNTSAIPRLHYLTNTFSRVVVPQVRYEARTPYLAALEP